MFGFTLCIVMIALALDVAAGALVAGAGNVSLTGISAQQLAAQLREALASIELSRGAPALAAAAFLLLVYRVREQDGLAPPPPPPASRAEPTPLAEPAPPAEPAADELEPADGSPSPLPVATASC